MRPTQRGKFLPDLNRIDMVAGAVGVHLLVFEDNEMLQVRADRERSDVGALWVPPALSVETRREIFRMVSTHFPRVVVHRDRR